MTLTELLEAVKAAPDEELPALALEIGQQRAGLDAAEVALRLRVNAPTTKDDPAPADRNVDIYDAASLTGMSIGWLRKHVRTLPFSVHVGRRRLFSTEGIRKWNEANKRRTRAERT